MDQGNGTQGRTGLSEVQGRMDRQDPSANYKGGVHPTPTLPVTSGGKSSVVDRHPSTPEGQDTLSGVVSDDPREVVGGVLRILPVSVETLHGEKSKTSVKGGPGFEGGGSLPTQRHLPTGPPVKLSRDGGRTLGTESFRPV